jgi:asparagine synthase (glutamine-hydrolysing)
MCGIWAYIGQGTAKGVDEAAAALVARGPEGTRILKLDGATFVFTRLAINGLNPAGMQPFDLGGQVFMCNGEIYNAAALATEIGYESVSGSDCEVLGALWKSCAGDAVAFARALDGVFALVLKDGDDYVIARDPYGVRPLYWARTEDGYYFGSERKTLVGFADVQEFPPGQVWRLRGSNVERLVYHTVPWVKAAAGKDWSEEVRCAMEAAVHKRLLAERPVAALLSGGLDSSLIAALVQQSIKGKGGCLETFSIGMAGSTDLRFAGYVAAWIGSKHHEIVVTADEMFAVIPDVIRAIESYDITTVRASVGNWMVAREVRARSDCKVVFNGDGSDEVWGSYLYMGRAPTGFAFERESERLLSEIHQYDVLRSDRCLASHGLEARTPFLDKQVVAVARSVPTKLRTWKYSVDSTLPRAQVQIEKQLLRDAFSRVGLLPQEVLWRRKEAFSDGVSGTERLWFEEIQSRVAGLVPADWETQAARWTPRPQTAEAFWYRSLYEEYYGAVSQPWPYWMPRWSPETKDPSARTLGTPSELGCKT